MAGLGGRVISAGGGDNHVKYLDSEAIAAVEGEATLALAGDVDVATGKTLSSDGLLFPDTQVASSDANMLDDYEEGTFIATIMDNSLDGSGEGQGYTSQVGRYTKIGNKVFFFVNLVTSSLGTLTGSQQVKIGGLPFVAANTATASPPIMVGTCSSFAVTALASVTGVVQLNTAYIATLLWDTTAGNTIFILDEWTANGNAKISGFYTI